MTSFGEAYGVLFKMNCAWCGNIVAIKLNYDYYLQQKLKKNYIKIGKFRYKWMFTFKRIDKKMLLQKVFKALHT